MEWVELNMVVIKQVDNTLTCIRSSYSNEIGVGPYTSNSMEFLVPFLISMSLINNDTS